MNEARVINEFIRLAGIDSISFRERRMADCLAGILESLGFLVSEDSAGHEIGGDCGNLIGFLKGDSKKKSILLAAHMDTVQPGLNKKAIFDGTAFRSDGTTVLGGDNVAGIVIILETLRHILENGIGHGDIWVLFTVAEECGLMGAACFDFTSVKAELGIVLDCHGKPGIVALRSLGRYDIEVAIKGRAAHAGVEPEKGISAIQIAARAISGMRLGRIDSETTANIGIINGGSATNIVCDHLDIKAEVRGLEKQKLVSQVGHMKDCLNEAAEFYGGSYIFNAKQKYPILSLEENQESVQLLKKSAADIGLKLEFITTGGGSDANIINDAGIPALNLAIGMDKMHTREEYIELKDMLRSSELVISMIKNL